MTRTLGEVVVSLILIALAAFVYWETLSIPPGLYDPLGAGTMPRIICGGMIIFSVIAIVQSLLRHRSRAAAGQTKPRGPAAADDRPWLAVVTFGLMVVLAVAINFEVPYWASTTVFLFLAMMAVQRFKPSAVLVSALLAIIFAVGVTYLFSNVFSVDLP
jgi:hypothetical protein